jgi:hypothetical protein
MSWLSSGLRKVGGVAKKAAPLAGLIPGVGTVAGGLIGGLGSLASGDNIGEALKYGAKGAVGGYLGNAAGGLGGILGGLKRIGGGGLPNADRDYGITGSGSIGGKGDLSGLPMPSIGGAPKSGGLGGILGGLLGGSGGIGGLLSGGLKKIGGVDGLLGGAATGYGAYQMKQAGDMRNKALKMVEQDYATRAPLRSQGLAGMLNEQRPDLSSTFASNNPFSRRVA